MWVRPNPQLTNIWDIFKYALTVDGYEYAAQHFPHEGAADGFSRCGALANAKAKQLRKTGRWTGSFEELRCCLFFEQRRWRHFGYEPEGEDLAMIRALHEEICRKWDEAPGNRVV